MLIAEKFALVFEPPTVIVQYRAQDTGKRRLRKLRLDAKTVVATPSVEALTQKILRSLPKKLDLATVKSEQVQRLVQRLVDKCRGNTTTTAAVNASVDYNKLGDDDVAAVKKAMDVDFEKNRKFVIHCLGPLEQRFNSQGKVVLVFDLIIVVEPVASPN